MAQTMTINPIKILYFGSTGYIGGTALNTIIQSPQTAKLSFTLLVRAEDKKKKLEQLYSKYSDRISYVHDSNDKNFIEDLSSKHDIVANLADADYKQLTEAIVKGLGKRKQQNIPGVLKQPIYIHTSGTSLLNGWAKLGEETEYKKVWSDNDYNEIWNLNEREPHHEIDLAALRGCEHNNIQLVVMMPPTITGIGTGLNKLSIQVPNLIRAAVARGQAGYVGTGLNSWSYINVEDLADGYLLLLTSAIEGKLETGRNCIYFAENGHYQHKQLAQKVAQTLNKLDSKRFPNTDVKPFGEREIKEYLLGDMVSMIYCGNSVVRADRLKTLGWKPKRAGLYDTLEDECRLVLQEFAQK